MYKRKIIRFLSDWSKKPHKEALLIKGARQVGKTTVVREFGKKNYRSFVEINFELDPNAKIAFDGKRDTKTIIGNLSLMGYGPFIEGKTLVFFDEIQSCPNARTAIKFLVDEGNYRYIMSGSLLGVELNDLRSEPVGYMDVKEMFPLDMEEFFMAVGLSQMVMDELRDAWERKRPVDEFVHAKLMELFRLYLIVGGMPAAVQKYIDSNNLQIVLAEQQSILRLYKRDIAKYDKKNKLYLEAIFDLIPSELNAKNKRFILKNLNENAKFSHFENSFIWLKETGVALPVYNVEEPVIPLKLSRSRNLFKLFQNDVGLLASQYADGIQLRLLTDAKSINFGSVYENAIAQELSAHGFDLYYFNSKKQGELDFVIEKSGAILPIEVKSGKDYHRHNALSNLMSNQNYPIPEAIVFSNENFRQTDKVMYLPVYLAMFIEKQTPVDITYKVDLSGL